METEKKQFCIKFKDGINEYFYRMDAGHGKIMVFASKKEAESFLKDLDPREFDRWIEAISPGVTK